MRPLIPWYQGPTLMTSVNLTDLPPNIVTWGLELQHTNIFSLKMLAMLRKNGLIIVTVNRFLSFNYSYINIDKYVKINKQKPHIKWSREARKEAYVYHEAQKSELFVIVLRTSSSLFKHFLSLSQWTGMWLTMVSCIRLQFLIFPQINLFMLEKFQSGWLFVHDQHIYPTQTEALWDSQ